MILLCNSWLHFFTPNSGDVSFSVWISENLTGYVLTDDRLSL